MFKPPKIGMRIIKTALSILITLVLTDLAARKILGEVVTGDYLSVSIAVVACIVVMQDSIKATIQSSKERIEATLIGVIIGSGFMAILLSMENHEQWYYVQRAVFYLSASIGSVMTIYVCMVLKGKGLSSLSVIVFISVLFSYTDSEPWFSVVMRFLETLIGVFVAVSINVLICPPPLECKVSITPTEKQFRQLEKFNTQCALCIRPKDSNDRCDDCPFDDVDVGFVSHDSDVY